MTKPKEPDFEAAMQRLGDIVEHLEQRQLPLEESLRLFEEGILLTRVTQARLDAAEKRLEELLAVGPDGTPVTRPIATTAGDDDDRAPEPARRAGR